MYTPEERDQQRDALVSFARKDDRIVGAAITGSAVSGLEDRWSDIDLAFGVADTADFDQTIAKWTDMMYSSHGAVHHLDIISNATVYRVFMLSNTLQVDLAFSPASRFGALAPTFRLLFGTAQELSPARGRDASQLIGWGWLYAIHIRSSIARGRVWQAEHMISGARDQVLALACLRHGLPASEGRGIDDLPSEITTVISEALIGSLDISALSRAFCVVIDGLIAEIDQVNAPLANRLAGPLRDLADRDFNE